MLVQLKKISLNRSGSLWDRLYSPSKIACKIDKAESTSLELTTIL
ncbi:hypothetical protein [Spirochaeta cellobiosiphila]|nr:hypothetical protein [Spirochaeta cellobiosiphila]